MPQKYIHDQSHVVSVEELEINKDVSYVTQPVAVVDRKEQILRNKVIPLVKSDLVTSWKGGNYLGIVT